MKISIIVPFFNEEANVGPVLDEIRGEVEDMCRKFPLYEDRWNDKD